MIRPLRLPVAVLGLLAGTLASADPIVCRLRKDADAQSLATRYEISLTATGLGKHARFEVPRHRVARALAQLRRDRRVVAAEADVRLRTVQSDGSSRPRMVQKGSTIPVVGDRATLTAANADILRAINWSPTLAQASGRTVRIAILDTGLAPTAIDLWSKVDAQRNFIETGSAYDQPTNCDTSGDGLLDEGVGHGTVVAGIIDQVAPETRLVIARVADSDGFASGWTVAQGIHFALAKGAEVINISLADRRRSLLVELAVREAELAGATVVASMGNDNAHDAYEPADTSTVTAVSAVDLSGLKASFSNWQSVCDVAAPGTAVTGRYWTDEQIQWAGTSFASAFVSGAVGDCLRRRSRVLPVLVRRALSQSGRNIDAQNPSYVGQLGRLLDIQALDRELDRR